VTAQRCRGARTTGLLGTTKTLPSEPFTRGRLEEEATVHKTKAVKATKHTSAKNCSPRKAKPAKASSPARISPATCAYSHHRGCGPRDRPPRQAGARRAPEPSRRRGPARSTPLPPSSPVAVGEAFRSSPPPPPPPPPPQTPPPPKKPPKKQKKNPPPPPLSCSPTTPLIVSQSLLSYSNSARERVGAGLRFPTRRTAHGVVRDRAFYLSLCPLPITGLWCALLTVTSREGDPPHRAGVGISVLPPRRALTSVAELLNHRTAGPYGHPLRLSSHSNVLQELRPGGRRQIGIPGRTQPPRSSPTSPWAAWRSRTPRITRLARVRCARPPPS